MIKSFKLVSILEGLSYLGLLFVGVPMKYFMENDTIVKMLGMPHGMLFLAYILFVLIIRKRMKWNGKTTGIMLLASILPFGTFYVIKKYMDD